MKTLYSNLDSSVNFIEQQLTGFIETRYVRRTEEYFIGYLSSQTGCNRGCKMCHLTATKQTQFVNCDQQDFISQLETIFTHYHNDIPAKTMHINFMARGEILANPTVTETGTELLSRLGNMVIDKGLKVKFNVSTILPKTMKKTLTEIFPLITPTIYYSVYSVNPTFREKWLPGAMDTKRAFDLLAEYQSVSKKIVKLHCAFIKGENDSDDDIFGILNEVTSRNIRAEFNIVRYNPFSTEQGIETDRLPAIQSIISDYMPCKIIPKVGFDVSASCGQFVPSSVAKI